MSEITRIHDEAIELGRITRDGYVVVESGDVLQYVLWDMARIAAGQTANRTAAALAAVKAGGWAMDAAEAAVNAE